MSVQKVRDAIRAKYQTAGSYVEHAAGSYAEGSTAQPVQHVRHEVFLGGVTGLVATQFGGHNMGITVGRLETGIYGVSFPDTAHVSIMAGISLPTGSRPLNVSVGGMSGLGRIVGASGQAQVKLDTLQGGATGLNFELSIVRTPANPSQTGTVLSLDFLFSGNYLDDKTTLVPY